MCCLPSMMYDHRFLYLCACLKSGMGHITPSCPLFSDTYNFNPTTVQLTMFCFSVFQVLVEFCF